jgi:transposase
MGEACIMKSIRDNPVKIRRKFDQTFKREAVENWLSSGKSAEVVAQELGLLANRLYAWKKRFAPPDAGGRAAGGAKPGSMADLQARLDALQRENRHLREQRDILKKTLGILSEPPMSATNGSTP